MNDDHTGIILEDIQSQLQRLAEAMAEVPSDVRELKESVENLSADMKTVKAVVTDQSKVLDNHDQRLTSLEQTA